MGLKRPHLAHSQASCLVLKSKVSEASVVGGGCYIFIDTGHTVGAKTKWRPDTLDSSLNWV